MVIASFLSARINAENFARGDAHPTPVLLETSVCGLVAVYVALPAGAYRYDATAHALHLAAAADVRRVTGYQDFVDEAPLDLVFVADYSRFGMVPAHMRESYASVAAGAIAQNVYLFAAANGLATVIRAWIDRDAIAHALGLTHDQHVLLSQTVGFPTR